MKKQLILMFSFMMLFALSIDTVTAQTPTTTTRTETTETVKKEGWWKRTFGKKKKKKNTVKATAQKPRTDVKTGGVKPPKTGGVKPPKTGGVKPTKDVKVVKPKTDRVKPNKPSKSTSTRPEGPTKAKKPTKPKKDIPVVTNKKDKVKPNKPNKPSTKNGDVLTGSKKGSATTRKKIPNNSNGKVRKVESKPAKTTGMPHPSTKGAPQCGVKGCEHPGKHEGLHKKQYPVRPYKWTEQGYKEVDEKGGIIKKKATIKKPKKIKTKN